jgi:zinc transport system substrate-binding protein
MTTRRPAPLLSILALGGASMLVAACGGGAGTAESSSAAAPATSAATSPTAEPSPSAEPLKVVAAFYPLQYAAEQVGGAAVEVTNLTPPGAEPHDLELTPQDVVAIGEADLVLYIPGFQPALDEAIAQEAADRSLDVTTELDDLLKGHDHDHSDEGHSDEGHSDEGHSDEGHSDEGHSDEGHSDEGHDHGDETGIDPHVWLNPINMGLIGGQIAERLAEIAPESTESFVSGSDALMSAMQLLDTEWASGTAECANRLLVVSHEAFGYLAAQYNFEQVGISGLSPDAEPSPAKVAEVIDIVKSDGVTTIYFETLVDPKIAEVVAAETGAQTATLDPLEGLTDGASGDYVSIMQANLASVQAGNGCA